MVGNPDCYRPTEIPVERRNELWEQSQSGSRTDDVLYARLLEQERGHGLRYTVRQVVSRDNQRELRRLEVLAEQRYYDQMERDLQEAGYYD